MIKFSPKGDITSVFEGSKEFDFLLPEKKKNCLCGFDNLSVQMSLKKEFKMKVCSHLGDNLKGPLIIAS